MVNRSSSRGTSVRATNAVLDVVRLSGGHPLTLVLASLAANSGAVDWSAETMDRLLEQFTAAYFGDLASHEIEVLEAASVVRCVTRPLLAALVPGVDPAQGYVLLRSMPFVQRSADGLVIHESVQAAVGSELRSRDPRTAPHFAAQSLGSLPGRAARAAAGPLWQHTADMIYLLQQPEVRRGPLPDRCPPLCDRTCSA